MRRPVLTTVLLTVVPVLALSSPATAGEGATIVRGVFCAIPVDEEGVPDGAVFTTRAKSVTTPSGRAALVCHGTLPEGLRPERTTVYDSGRCGVAGQLSSATSHTVATRSGRLLLTCLAVGRPATG